MSKAVQRFTLPVNLITTVKLLPKEQAGSLFLAILEYCNHREPEIEETAVSIVFENIRPDLDSSLMIQERIRERNRINGMKGGRPKKKSKKKINGKKVSKPLEVRKEEFRQQVQKYIGDKYTKKLATDFFKYWTEHGPNDKKMKFEKEKTFGIGSRLHTWWNLSKKREEKSRL